LAVLAEIIQTREGDGLTHHTYADIGRFTVFPINHFKRMFPTKPFGTLQEDDFERNKTYGIMTREEGLRITNELHRLTLPSERKLPYRDISTWSNGQVKETLLSDDSSYVQL
jgi:hypothetical protein